MTVRLHDPRSRRVSKSNPLNLHRPASTTILVADEQAFSRRIIRSVLTGLGRVIECRTGFDAVESAEQLRPSLIVLGMNLSGLDGVEVTQMLRRADGGLEFTPIIMISGYPTRASVLGAVTAGVHEYVARPFSTKTLRSRAESVLAMPRPFVRSRVYFGPVPRAKTVRHEVLGKVGEESFASMICGVHHARADQALCPLGIHCLCQSYIRPSKDIFEL